MSLSKKLFIVAAVILGIILLNVFNKSSGDRNGYFTNYQERQKLDPVDNTDEWMQRLKLDLENLNYNSSTLVNLYAELPPKSEWPKLAERIDELAGDVGKIEEWLKDNSHGQQADIISRKLRIFSKLLKEPGANVEPDIRELIKLSNSNGYYHSHALLIASKDRKMTLEWIEKNQADSLSSHSSSVSYSSHTESSKSASEQALADNRVDEGIALVKKEISQASTFSETTQYWDKLLRVALLTDRMSLATEAADNLKKNLLLHVKTDERHINYSYDSVFKLDLNKRDWESIIKTLDEVYAVQKSKNKAMVYGDYGYLDEAHALYLTAFYELGRIEEFIEGIASAQNASKESPEDFFRMLGRPTVGQKTLGITYVEHLRKTGDIENARAHAMHLLARNRGEDVYYQTLIDLDAQQAGSFIESVRKYDPYEERPLIWLAEMARRDGNLELALKTIEEAIALDPSDGDHGKDSRMFCYEVLARIHKDAGRQEKAEFFRSVVDSIRQGEAADDYLYAGLIKEATERYQKALGQFEDAYCLQSRLAMTLARNGQFDESVKHFKKAFELMPVSFGPRESHCFGCEGLFSDPRVIEIAKPLLQEFEKSNPENARAPYLLGLVLKQNNEMAQAAIAFRRAFEIDPHYYNAATKLLEIYDNDIKHYDKVEALHKKIFPIAPFSSKADYLYDFANLHNYWDLTEMVVSPMVLPPLPFLELKVPSADKQYAPSLHDDFSYLGYRHDPPIGGWSPSHLRRMNAFLFALDQIR